MKVWVLENTEDADSSTQILLFEDKQDAFSEASELGRLRRVEFDCDVLGDKHQAQYLDLCVKQSTKHFEMALEVYQDWNADLDLDDSISISVYEGEVKPTSGKNNYLKIGDKHNMPVTKASTKLRKPDVPCKVCGHKVNDIDTHCWWCLVENPGVK